MSRSDPDNGYQSPWIPYLWKALAFTGAMMVVVYLIFWPAPVQPRCEATQQPDTSAQECRRK